MPFMGNTHSCHICLSRYTFEKPRLRCVLQDAAGEEDTRLLLLAETVQEEGQSAFLAWFTS